MCLKFVTYTTQSKTIQLDLTQKNAVEGKYSCTLCSRCTFEYPDVNELKNCPWQYNVLWVPHFIENIQSGYHEVKVMSCNGVTFIFICYCYWCSSYFSLLRRLDYFWTPYTNIQNTIRSNSAQNSNVGCFCFWDSNDSMLAFLGRMVWSRRLRNKGKREKLIDYSKRNNSKKRHW